MITFRIVDDVLKCVIDREKYYRSYTFPLVSVSKEEVQLLRLYDNSGKKWFLFKEGQSLKLADISRLPNNTRVTISFADRINTHICPSCRYQSALPDEQGGCKKCRQRASMLELVDDIVLGVETWGTRGADVLDVFKCTRYKNESIPIPKQSEKKQSNYNPGSWRNMKTRKLLGYELIG